MSIEVTLSRRFMAAIGAAPRSGIGAIPQLVSTGGLSLTLLLRR